jgi:hypothetical protein
MWYSFVLKSYRSQLRPSTLTGLADRVCNLISFSEAQTNASLLITHDDQCTKAKATATLNYLCRPINEYCLFDKTITIPFWLLTPPPRPIATVAAVITTPFRTIGSLGHRWLLRCFYLGFFRHKRSSDGG